MTGSGFIDYAMIGKGKKVLAIDRTCQNHCSWCSLSHHGKQAGQYRNNQNSQSQYHQGKYDCAHITQADLQFLAHLGIR